MLAPVFGTILVIVTYPFLLAVVQSLQDAAGREFVGMGNYANALANPLLYEALGATGTYAALVMPTEIVLGLGLALLVHRVVRSTGVRALLFVLATIPLVLPPIAVGVIARLIYAPGYGVLNHLLIVTGIVRDEINWLGQPSTAMPAGAGVDVLPFAPSMDLVPFYGLQSVPRGTIDA